MIDVSTVPGVLGDIGRTTVERVVAEKGRMSSDELVAKRIAGVKPKDVAVWFQQGTKPRVIAEVKLASPSEGDIALHLKPTEVAAQYLASGAHALSVLTEPNYFKGHIGFLREIRTAFPDAYLLMKDFFVSTYQLDQALWAGADAILIIVALVGHDGASLLLREATMRGLSALVEVHNQEELDIALALNASLIGINNRDLKTMKISLQTTRDLAPQIPKDCIIIGESGIKTAEDIRSLDACGCHGYLIGTHFMKSGQPGLSLKNLINSV